MREDNIEIMKRVCELQTSHEIDKLLGHLHDDAVWEEVALGIVANGHSEIRTMLEEIYASMPDHVAALTSTMAEEERGAAEFDMSGTVRGEYRGQQPTGKSFTVRVGSNVQFAQGRVTRWSSYKDSYALMLENPAAPPKEYGYRLDALNVPRFDDATTDILVKAASAFPSDGFNIVLHDFHGAAARVAPEATAFPLRREHINVQFAAGWNVAAGERDEEGVGWLRRNRAALSPSRPRGGYPNVLGPDQPDSVRAFYGDAVPRLMRAKERHDPESVIRSGNGRL